MEKIGILDPEGKNINPLNNKPYTDDYKKLAEIWTKFPAYEKVYDIIGNIIKHQVLLIVGYTGSGKTALVPKYVLHAYNYRGRIAVTLPKQIITKSIAEYSAKTLDVNIGEEVGYQYKGSPREARSKKTKLLFATDGTIVARLLKDPLLKKFDVVIVDEAHERKVQIDFLLFLLRETLRNRPDFKIIIMSATINIEIFERYFSEFKFKYLFISGRKHFPIKSIFLEKSLTYNEIIDKGYNILLEILKTDQIKQNDTQSHDILFFITSANEAFILCKRLKRDIEKMEKNKCHITCNGNVFCIEVFAGMDPKNQTLAQDKIKYKDLDNYNRKIVIATNVAESSITIDGIKFVIDSGYELKSSYDPDLRAKKLDRKIITHAQAVQRMGRSGRTEPGIVYHLYTKDEFENKMEKFPLPDIRVNDISNEILKLLSFKNIKTINKLLEIFTKFIEPPRENFIVTGINILIQLGLIENGEITKIGQIVSDIGIKIPSSLSLLMGNIYNCFDEINKIISLIEACKGNLNELFIHPVLIVHENVEKLKKLKEKFKKRKKLFNHITGDHLSLLNIYNQFNNVFKKNKKNENLMIILQKWCLDNFLKLNILMKAKNYSKIIKKQFQTLKDKIIDLHYEKDLVVENLQKYQKILYCLYYSRDQGTREKNTKIYKTLYSKNLKIKIDKNSFLHFNKELPKEVFYDELFIFLDNPHFSIVSKIPNISKK